MSIWVDNGCDYGVNRVLIIVKKRNDSYGASYGLLNSAVLTERYLNSMGICCKSVSVIDNNGIDREVSLFYPTHVIIEAIWVVPEKFHVLSRLHPTVKWVVRVHSELPFLANEGIAMDWLHRYLDIPFLVISANNRRMCFDLNRLNIRCVYLPNLYNLSDILVDRKKRDGSELNVGCFGAIRPMKNQFLQACGSMFYADSVGKRLVFHINSGRVEQKGESALKNIRNLFSFRSEHKLVEHGWMSHMDFVEYLRENIDIGLQVSFSETFNIVTADYINAGVPCVVSKEINWLPFLNYASVNSASSVSRAIGRVLFMGKFGNWLNGMSLIGYNKRSFKSWLNL